MDKKITGFLYKTGMFGTCANPLHSGHVATILKAAGECRELYIVLSYSPLREEVDFRLRHQWLAQTVSHLPHVRIIDLEDDAPTKEAYTEEHWRAGAERVKQLIGKPVDVIYCGSDYCAAAPTPYERHYPGARIIYADRAQIPISSTAIRQAPLQHWQYLAKAARPHYVRKVLIIGHESTGKSTMVQNLATLYDTEFVPELGRDVCARCGGTDFMLRGDFEEIISAHRAAITEATRKANRYLFIDTDAVTTYWYAKLSGIDIARPTPDNFDLILFLEADVPFVQDGLRSEANNSDFSRSGVSKALKQFYRDFGFSFHTIHGASFSERLANAMQYIDSL